MNVNISINKMLSTISTMCWVGPRTKIGEPRIIIGGEQGLNPEMIRICEVVSQYDGSDLDSERWRWWLRRRQITGRWQSWPVKTVYAVADNTSPRIGHECGLSRHQEYPHSPRDQVTTAENLPPSLHWSAVRLSSF